MKFSVIIPFYNREAYVAAVLDSVYAQSERDYEVIAVDDGSTDGTWNQLNSHHSRPKCIRLENGGAAIARNAAVAEANGDYLAFLDSDDLWFPNSLELYSKVINECGQPAVVTGNPAIFTNDKSPEQSPEDPLIKEQFSNYLEAYDSWRWFGVSSFVIRRDAFKEVAGFTSLRINAEDADLMLKLGCSEGFVHIRQPATFAYRRHEANLTKDQSMNLSGLNHIVATERKGGYPGSTRDQRKNRRIIITRHLRPAIISLIQAGREKEAWPLFKACLPWHIQQLRIRFIAFCSLKFLESRLRSN
ncbi:MAG: glycosyltransferase family 2 protein [Puniceicoccaceae bacterium]